MKRKALSGDERVVAEFPLAVMLARKLISREMYDQGMRFAECAWSLFGPPDASCAAVYERMTAEGFSAEFGPRVTPDDEKADGRERRTRAAYEEMRAALQPPGSARHALGAVQNAAQYNRFPRYVVNLATGARHRPSDHREMDDLRLGLDRLVALTEAPRKRAA